MPNEPLWTSILNMFNFRHERLWVWIAFAVVGGWVILINVMLMLAFTILQRESLLSTQRFTFHQLHQQPT